MDINIELNYEKKGVYGLSVNHEVKYISIPNNDDKEAVKNAIDIVNVGFKCLSRKDFFNTDMLISTAVDYSTKNPILRICYSYSMDVYELYIYGKNTTDTLKVGKKQAFNEIVEIIEKAIYM